MNVSYCDLCGSVVKEFEGYLLYVAPPNYKDSVKAETYEEYLTKVHKGTKEICPACKKIFDDIFRLRLQGLCHLTQELIDLYNLPEYKGRRKNDRKK